MFKKSQYEKIIEVLNENTQGLVFAGGYERVHYANGISTVIVPSTGSLFDWKETEVIPVTEEFNQETPSVNDSDRSDYICQYRISYALKNKDKVATALEEFRAYFVTNKHQVIDGYNVVFKTIRGDKLGSVNVQAGNDIGYYNLNVYTTASLGYLTKPTDGWEIRNVTQNTVFEPLPLIDETCGINYTVSPQTSEQRTTYKAENYNNTKDFNIYYDGSDFAKELYNLIIYGKSSGEISDVYAIKETFNGVVGPEMNVIISGASRTKARNAPLLMKFNVVPYEE